MELLRWKNRSRAVGKPVGIRLVRDTGGRRLSTHSGREGDYNTHPSTGLRGMVFPAQLNNKVGGPPWLPGGGGGHESVQPLLNLRVSMLRVCGGGWNTGIAKFK